MFASMCMGFFNSVTWKLKMSRLSVCCLFFFLGRFNLFILSKQVSLYLNPCLVLVALQEKQTNTQMISLKNLSLSYLKYA